MTERERGTTGRPVGRRAGTALVVVTAAVAVALDAATKAWATANLADGGVNLPGPLDLRLGYNRGVAFGLFADAPGGVMIALTGAVTVLVVAAAWRAMLPALPAGLILGGAIANLVDRLSDGKVVDLLHTAWWPTFNVADALITVGAGLLLFSSFGFHDHRPA